MFRLLFVFLWIDFIKCSDNSISTYLNPASFISRFFNCRISGMRSVAVTEDKAHGDLFELSQLLRLDPFDEAQILEQYKISAKRHVVGTKIDRLSNLPTSLLDLIFEFIPQEDLHKMRELSRNLLLNYIISTRSRFIRSLTPKISSGFEIIHSSTHSVHFMNLLTRPLKLLLSEETRYRAFKENDNVVRYHYSHISPGRYRTSVANLAASTDLQQFLIHALLFYRNCDLDAFISLLDSLARGKIFNFDDQLLRHFQVGISIILLSACYQGYVCLAKVALRTSYRFSDIELHSYLIGSVITGHLNLLKVIIKRVVHIEKKDIITYLETAIKHERVDIVQFLFENFKKHLNKYWPCFFDCIKARNLQILKLILQYISPCEFNLVLSSMNVLEFSAFEGFAEAIEIFCSYECGMSLLRKSPRPLRLAIDYGTDACVNTLIFFMSQLGPLDAVYQRSEFFYLIKSALIRSKHFILKFILANLNSKNWRDFYSDIGESEDKNNIIRYTIQEDDKESFDALLEHFGPSILNENDSFGRNAFLCAAFHGRFYYALHIAVLSNSSIFRRDKLGNNAFHLLLRNHSSPELIKLFATSFNINWYARNFDGVTPIDLFVEIEQLFSDEDKSSIYKSISESISYK